MRHFFVARIRYPSPGGDEPIWGLLFYIKPCLTGTEDADLYNFAVRFPSFPHDATADQAFSDAQFESYRRLGLLSGEDLCHRILKAPDQLWQVKKFRLSILQAALGDIPMTEEESFIDGLLEAALSADEDTAKIARIELAEMGDAAAPVTRRLLEIFLAGAKPVRRIVCEMLLNYEAEGVAALGDILHDRRTDEAIAVAAAKILTDYLGESDQAELAASLLRKAGADHASKKVKAVVNRSLRPKPATRQPGVQRRRRRPSEKAPN
jgi:hypothetical protein